MSHVYKDFRYLISVSHLLRNFKVTDERVGRTNFSCPYCGDSRKANWKARGYTFAGSTTLIFKCHNCGISKNFSQLLWSLDSDKWKDWKNDSTLLEPNYPLNFTSPVISVVQKLRYENMSPLSELCADHHAVRYVEQRNIPKSRYNLLYYSNDYKSLVDEIFPGNDKNYRHEERLVLCVRDESGDLVGLVGRSLGSSKLRYANAKRSGRMFFGLERVKFDRPILVVEGAIDSLFLGNSIAVCSSNLFQWTLAYPRAHSILIYDNEPDNFEIVRSISNAIDSGATVCSWFGCPFQGKDINEMVIRGTTVREILTWILENSFSGDNAEERLLLWKSPKV
jgi:hypothetical protein